jgi:hypothetical protein
MDSAWQADDRGYLRLRSDEKDRVGGVPSPTGKSIPSGADDRIRIPDFKSEICTEAKPTSDNLKSTEPRSRLSAPG